MIIECKWLVNVNDKHFVFSLFSLPQHYYYTTPTHSFMNNTFFWCVYVHICALDCHTYVRGLFLVHLNKIRM